MLPDDIIAPQYVIIPLEDGKFRIDSIVYKKNNGKIQEYRNFVAEKPNLMQAKNVVMLLTM